MTLFAGLEQALHTRGLHAVLLAGADPVASAIHAVTEGRIDGLISPVFSLSKADRLRLTQSGVPHVLTHVPPESDHGPTVALDAAAGITAAVNHLADLGHRSLLWLGPDPTPVHDAVSRARAFRDACKARNLDGRELHSGDANPTIPAIIEAARETLLPVLTRHRRRR